MVYGGSQRAPKHMAILHCNIQDLQCAKHLAMNKVLLRKLVMIIKISKSNK